MSEKDYGSILRQKEEGNGTNPGEDDMQHSVVGGTQFIFVNYSYQTGWHLDDRHHFLDSERRRWSRGAVRPQGVRPCRRSTSCHACAGGIHEYNIPSTMSILVQVPLVGFIIIALCILAKASDINQSATLQEVIQDVNCLVQPASIDILLFFSPTYIGSRHTVVFFTHLLSKVMKTLAGPWGRRLSSLCATVSFNLYHF